MVLAIITLITALISYFGSKKAGASDGEAALIAAGVGAGTYYVGSQTEWGKDLITGVSDKWTDMFGSDGEPVLNNDGTTVKAPPGAVPVVDDSGVVQKDSNGNVLWKVVDSAGNVLESWGPTGTATVIGAGAIAADDNLRKWIPIGLVAAGAIILLK